MAETSLGILMKEIGEALQLDNDNFDKEAYVKYTSCIYNIAGNLVLGVNLSGGNVVIGPKTARHVKLLQQCVERVVALVSRMETHHSDLALQDGKYVSPQTTPVATRPDAWKGQVSASKTEGTGAADYFSTSASPAHHETTCGATSRPVSFHSPVPALPPENNPHLYSHRLAEKQKMSPIEMARKQNRSLLIAYKARMNRLNKSNFSAFNYSLTVQRKMAENLAIAQVQEEELARKMKARQQRLEEEAARRFALPTGVSSEEQEQRQMYKNILMYENDVDHLQKWRKKLDMNPEDPVLICQLVQEVLRYSDHPLTEMLRKFQFKTYERTYPLVANKQRLIEEVEVDLPKHLWPRIEDISDVLDLTLRATSPPAAAPEVRKRRRGRNKGGRSESDKTDVSRGGEEGSSSSSSSSSTNVGMGDEDATTDPEAKDEKKSKERATEADEDRSNGLDKSDHIDGLGQATSHGWTDPLNVGNVKNMNGQSDHDDSADIVEEEEISLKSHVKEESSDRNFPDVEQGSEDEQTAKEKYAHGDTNETTERNERVRDDESKSEPGKSDAGGKRKESVEETTQLAEDDDEDEDSDTNTLTSVSESDSDDDRNAKVNVDQDGDDGGVHSMVTGSKHDLETAMTKGVRLESELSLQRKQAQLLMKQVTKNYESYNDENFDDLFDDEDDDCDDDNDEGVEANASENFSFNNKIITDEVERDAILPPPVVARRTNEREKGSGVVMDRSQSMQPVHVDTPTEPPPSMFHSLPYMPSSEGFGDEQAQQEHYQAISQLHEEACARHLQAISQDVHCYLDKLLSMMIIAYEALDTPVGKDQCAVSLEEPFFKPIWKTVLELFRIVYRKQELILASVMTKYANASPKDLNISEKFWLFSESNEDQSCCPYQPVIEELDHLSQHYTIASKLDCLVRVCRLICECVDKFYASKRDDGMMTSPKKAPSLGADDLLPVFTYVIIRTKNPQIVSECYAMLEFIQESYMMGEEGYCLTTLRTAIAYTLSLYKDIA